MNEGLIGSHIKPTHPISKPSSNLESCRTRNPMVHLQRSIGNRAVQRFLRSNGGRMLKQNPRPMDQSRRGGRQRRP